MPDFQVIPAIDLKGGRCVRLLQGDYAQETVYGDDPVVVAQRWASEGASRIHLVDLDGAASGRSDNGEAIRAIAASLAGNPARPLLDVGGGVRSMGDIEAHLTAGIDVVILGTIAVTNPDLVAEACARYPGQVAVGIDARDGKVAVRGWLDQTDVPALDLAQRAAAAGAREVILTDISRDGTLTEPHYSQIAEVVRVVSVPVIASGGVARVDQVVRVRETGAAGVIIGRALYTGDVSLGDALQLAGIA